MSQLVTIFGGSGFVGRYIARRMAKQGWRVKVAVRRPNDALFVKPYGVVGQVEPVFCNIRDDASVLSAVSGADVVVNCVGILSELGKNRFHSVQGDGAERIARLAAQEGAVRFVQISAIGADKGSDSQYSISKAQGEEGILQHFPDAVILRPSVIFGPEDQFFNRFASIARLIPVLPLIGADSKFQPVYVDDVAKVAELAVLGRASGGIYELGGPDVASFKSLMERMLTVIQRKSILLPLPFFLGRLMASAFDTLQSVSLGLLKNGVVTRDQIKNLARDNVVSGDHKTFANLGIEPTALDAVLADYLWCYRPSGQFAAIKDSAKNLRSSS
ncbi:MAG: complex I NDUFA9 subunit family protein [Rhodobacteraceae bacterium]|nr:complex I NDUFA9 subunit family protein [Paracoccaceae bacterium]